MTVGQPMHVVVHDTTTVLIEKLNEMGYVVLISPRKRAPGVRICTTLDNTWLGGWRIHQGTDLAGALRSAIEHNRKTDRT